jgi:hypothetical protein
MSLESFKSKIESIDKKLDKNNQVDEQKVIEKVQKIQKMFLKFKNTKLQKLKHQLPEDKFQILQKEFNLAEKSFYEKIKHYETLLNKIENKKLEDYQKLTDKILEDFF